MVCSQIKTKKYSEMEVEKSGEIQILGVTRLLTQLMIEKNTGEMSEIVDANFTLTHITGYLQSKEEWFAEIESERMKYYSYEEIQTSVKIEGKKAIFVGKNVLDARIWGSRNIWRLQQKMELEKRSDKWIIIKSVASIF